jgi:hypothetical protein
MAGASTLRLNDNNFPVRGGRAPDCADDDELIVVRLDRPLEVARRRHG